MQKKELIHTARKQNNIINSVFSNKIIYWERAMFFFLSRLPHVIGWLLF